MDSEDHIKMKHSNINSEDHSKMRGGHKSHDHSSHIADFKKRFFVSLIITIPILLFSEQIQLWFKYSLDIPYQNIISLLFVTILYVYNSYL